MAWTQPQTWTSVAFTASNLNVQIRDNLEALKDPPSANYELDESSNYTTTSTTFTNVDTLDTDGKLRLTIETTGGDVFVHFHGVLNSNTAAGAVYLNVSVDGTDIAADDGIIFQLTNAGSNAEPHPISFTRLITGLSAGTHIFRLRWKVTTATTGTLYAGAGTSGRDIHPQFWVREIS